MTPTRCTRCGLGLELTVQRRDYNQRLPTVSDSPPPPSSQHMTPESKVGEGHPTHDLKYQLSASGKQQWRKNKAVWILQIESLLFWCFESANETITKRWFGIRSSIQTLSMARRIRGKRGGPEERKNNNLQIQFEGKSNNLSWSFLYAILHTRFGNVEGPQVRRPIAGMMRIPRLTITSPSPSGRMFLIQGGRIIT